MLHCNVHSLDRLASTATKALKEEDTEAHVNSSCFGKGSAAINLIHGLSKMRYKDGVGSPSTFKCFLKDESVPCGLFVRYVGNTLHVLFHLAGVIFFLRDKLLEYLKKSCPVSNGLRGSLITDLSNTEICMQSVCNSRCLDCLARDLLAHGCPSSIKKMRDPATSN